jgi:hypothetical protein
MTQMAKRALKKIIVTVMLLVVAGLVMLMSQAHLSFGHDKTRLSGNSTNG